MEENLPKRNTPRDLFLHLLAIVTLYWSSITFVGILWQFINKFSQMSCGMEILAEQN
jgi:hypothetical protein